MMFFKAQISYIALIATFLLLCGALFAFVYSKKSDLSTAEDALHSVFVSNPFVDDSEQDTEDVLVDDEIVVDEELSLDIKDHESTEETVSDENEIAHESSLEDSSSGDLDHSRALLSLIVYDYGLSSQASEAIFETELSHLTLSLSPYTEDPQYWINTASRFKFDVWVSGYIHKANAKQQDYGPLSILEGLSRDLNAKRLAKNLENSAGTKGVIAYYNGSHMISEVADFYKGIKKRNLPFAMVSERPFLAIEEQVSHSSYLLPYYGSNDEVQAFFARLKKAAVKQGAVFAAVPPHPLVLEYLPEWYEELRRENIQIIPLSRLMSYLDEQQ